MPKKIEKVVIHCSDSPFGCATIIKDWHMKGRGWSDIGYGFVIPNGYLTSDMAKENRRWQWADGSVEAGRPFDDDTLMEGNEIEAQVFGWNDRTIGGCLVGDPGKFTVMQLYSVKRLLMQFLLPVFRLDVSAVVGHYELDKKKTCPGMDMNIFRKWLLDGDSYRSEMSQYVVPQAGRDRL